MKGSTTCSWPSPTGCAGSPRSSISSSRTTAGDVLAAVHREGEVLDQRHDADGVAVTARLEPASVGYLRDFVVRDDGDDAGPGAGTDDAGGSGRPA